MNSNAFFFLRFYNFKTHAMRKTALKSNNAFSRYKRKDFSDLRTCDFFRLLGQILFSLFCFVFRRILAVPIEPVPKVRSTNTPKKIAWPQVRKKYILLYLENGLMDFDAFFFLRFYNFKTHAMTKIASKSINVFSR